MSGSSIGFLLKRYAVRAEFQYLATISYENVLGDRGESRRTRGRISPGRRRFSSRRPPRRRSPTGENELSYLLSVVPCVGQEVPVVCVRVVFTNAGDLVKPGDSEMLTTL